MKKTLLLILTIVLLIIAVFTTADLFQSAWYVFSLEKITTTSAGLLFGKLVFLVVILLVLYFSLKFLRKSKP
ncbi:hypothetical protein [Enterobacter quasimori]|uniref:HemY N-terminal domain-containing protein n=1 Tax=Enterobacter quasimori TaxID=2838947 RepID=A0ABY0AR89_9ENTR|nr:hypothetical protein [Enterobacter quasimori]MBT1728715.1 hypothetical protein [Enterobacter quasimori]RTN23053.1 hypothetical protein EKN94_13805 [Enterobacter quasimori]